MASRRSLPMMNVVNLLRLIVFFTILIFGLIVMGLTAHFAEILVPSDLTRFVTVGLVVSIITLIITTAIFLLGIFRTYIYAAQTRIELAWLGVLAVLWMALAVFLSASADVEIDCADAGGAIQENQSVGMTSDEFEAEYRAMQACSFINAILLVAWFLLLLSFAVAHHFSGYKEVWRTPVADYGWFINPLGSRRRRAMDEKVKQALGGLSSETSLSTEEEILGRSRTRHRVRERDREAVGRNALLPVALFRPFYAIPEGATNRPKPARAATQPIIDISARQTNPIHALGSGHPASRPTTPVRPAPPVRMNSTPQPGRQATPPLVTALSRNVSAKSAQTFMTAKSAQSARTPVVPSQRPRTPVTTTPQRPRTPVTAGPPRPKTPVNAVQPARSAVPPTQRPRTPVSTSQPGRPPTQPVRSASQTAVPQRTGSQSSPIRPVVVRTASTPQSAPAGQPPSAPTSRARQTSSSQRPRPPPIVTTTSAAKQLPSPVAPQAVRSPPTTTLTRSNTGPALTRTAAQVRATPSRPPNAPNGARPPPVRTGSTPQTGAATATTSRPPLSRSQTMAVAMARPTATTPTTPRPAGPRSPAQWQAPPGRTNTLAVPVTVGREGLRNWSRSPVGRMV